MSTHPSLATQTPPALQQCGAETQEAFDDSFRRLRDFMHICREKYPQVRSGMLIEMHDGEQHSYLSDEDISTLKAVVRGFHETFMDIMREKETPAARADEACRLMQGMLHGCVFRGNNPLTMQLASDWLQDCQKSFLAHASHAEKLAYGPAFKAAIDYGKLNAHAYTMLEQMLEARHEAAGAEGPAVTDCYTLALTRYEQHYPSRKGQPLDAVAQRQVQSYVFDTLHELFAPYDDALPERMLPEMAGCLNLAMQKHIRHATRMTGKEKAANDNFPEGRSDLEARVNKALKPLFDRHKQAGVDAPAMLEAWRDCKKQMGPRSRT